MGGIHITSKTILSLGAVAILLSVAYAPVNAQTTLVDLSLGFALDETFDDSDGGWTSTIPPPGVRPGPTNSWQWGAPTSGPNAAASGANVWATNLAGLYGASECAALMSPPIDLTGASSASVSFREWHHFEQGTSTTSTGFDAGLLMVTTDGGKTLTVVTPAGGYTTNPLGTSARACFDNAPTTLRGITGPGGTTVPAPVYNTITSDLSAFAGQTVQFLMAFASDGSAHRLGWYVDDFAVTIDGVTTVEDFESSDGGFTMVGTKAPNPSPTGWDWGTPAVGPGPVSTMWGTNTSGKYARFECSAIESPAFRLGDVPANAAVRATLSWNQWFKSSSTSAAGVVQIGTADGYVNVAPTTGYATNPTSLELDACLNHRANGGAFAGTTLNTGTDMIEYQADLSEFVGQEITVRFVFASTSSTLTYEGWYVDNVAVELRVVAAAPDAEDIIDGLGIPGLSSADAPGWTQGGPLSTWAYGVTSAKPQGETVYKTNLAGNHDRNECSYIESPAIPTALLGASPVLRFEHWHRIAGVSVNVPWAAGIVLVSGDNGETWEHLAMDDYTRAVRTSTYTKTFDNCLVNFGADIEGGAYGGAREEFYWSEADLSAFADSPTIKVRFAYGSDGTFAYEGWAIRAVELGGVKLL